MAENDEVTLLVNGMRLQWWQSVRIASRLTAIARTFSVSLTKDLSSDEERLPVKPGDEVEVLIGNDIVLSGYITKTAINFSASSVSFTVEGSSKTVDLIDCTLPLSARHAFKGIAVRQAIAEMASHYAIEVKDIVGLTDAIDCQVAPIKKVQAVIDELAKKHSFLIHDDEYGRLVITMPGAAEDADDLITGVNLLSGSKISDVSGVFSSYAVVGQGPNAKSEKGVKDHQKQAVVENASVRTRHTVKVVEGEQSLALLTKRAALVMDVAEGSSETLKFTVNGWRQQSGDLWCVNSIAKVSDPITETYGSFLVSSVTFKKDRSGTTTELELKGPNAFLSTEYKSPEEAAKQVEKSKYAKKGKTEGADWTKT